MMRYLIFAACLFLDAGTSSAQSNLEPDNAALFATGSSRLYGVDYARKLKPEIRSDVRVFAIVEGGLVPDFAVGLKRVKSDYRIFMLGERRTGDGLDHCEAAIANDLAMDVVLAWDKVLRQTQLRRDRPRGGADVPIYHFGSRLLSGLVMGRVWDTPPDSNPAQLGRIAGGLLQICSGGKVQPIPEAMAEIRTALRRIH
jgi:hypothetical protein